jgi:PadR family transcriptional regulator AphA
VSEVPALSLTEWAVLGLIAEGRTHGFAVGRELAPTGSVGRIWTIPRPLVYRAIATLGTRGLVREAGSATGELGPPRRLVEVTAGGREALDRWLGEPIAHVRDGRSELMMKLLLLERSGRDPSGLLAAQQALFARIVDRRAEQLAASEGFDTTLARWRLYSAEAALRMVAELLADQRGRASQNPARGSRTPVRARSRSQPAED